MKYYTALAVNILFLFAYICPPAQTEVFTALEDLGKLLLTNREIIDVLDSYLALEEDRLKKLKWFKGQYNKIYHTARKNEEAFLANPVNAFVLVKRLSQDWDSVRYMIEGAPSRALVQNDKFEGFLFPDEEDLEGAAAALLRLQDTYLLKTSQLAKGEVAGVKSSSELTAGDCYELGKEAYSSWDCKRAMQWLGEAYIRVDREKIPTASKPFILELTAECAYELKNVTLAIEITRQIISMAPQHPGVMDTLTRYENAKKTKGDNYSSDLRSDDGYYSYYSDNEDQEGHAISYDSSERDFARYMSNYERLCRGERLLSPLEESKLKCQYTTNGNSYLLLQPVKQEIVSLDPFICIYHDIISDNDVEIFKELARHKLSRAHVINADTGKDETAEFRVSKSAWLKDKSHRRIAYASKVLEVITGLDTKTAEALHVINYGIGGHYEPHYDFTRRGETLTQMQKHVGNRIATWIYYFSDVKAGGATVFPKLGVSIKPRKGSAVFWYNLRRNGAGDHHTLHAGCPVLSGSKWIGNKWFHEYGNEFKRKCSLKPWE